MQRAPTSCSPPRGVAANCATLRVAEATTHSPPKAAGFGLGAPRHPPMASSLSVQAVEDCGVWGRGWQQKTLCVPPLREASARATLWVAGAQHVSVGFGLRAPGGGPKAQRASPAALRAAKAQPIRPRRTPLAPLMRRCARGRRFLSESRTRSQFKRTKPAGFGVEAGSKRRCASLRGGRLRPTRFFESQAFPVYSERHRN